MKITKEQFDKLTSDDITKKEYENTLVKINGRMEEIVRKIANNKNNNRFWYDYSNGDYDSEDTGGYFDPLKYQLQIEFIGICEFPSPYSDEDGDGLPFFPTRWLWEDYEEEFKNAVEKAKIVKDKAQEIEYRKREEKNIKEAALRGSIKSKLTKEELNYLGIK